MNNIILLCIILIILLYIFITKRLYKSNQDYIFVLISILVLSYIFSGQSEKNIKVEKYENKQKEIQIIVDHENINNIKDSLLVYLTSYSNNSFNKGFIWNNISPNKTTDNNSFSFVNEPIYTSMKELKLQSNKLMGPYSMNLGIDMSKDFTLFLNIKIPKLTTNQKLFKIFELYAIKDNIGIFLHLIQDIKGELFLKIMSAFTKDIYYKLSNFSLFDNNYHLITLTKNSEFLKLYIDNYIDNTFNLPVQEPIQVFDNKFSNRTTTILDNIDNNIISYITHFGIYNKTLNLNELTTLYNYIKDVMLKQSDTYNKLLKEFKDVKNNMNSSKENPFNNNLIKDNCKMIKDWSNFDLIISKADDNCLKAINQYCQTDETFKQCHIWNSFQKIAPYFTKENDTKLTDIEVPKIDDDKNDSNILETKNISKQNTQIKENNLNISENILNNKNISKDILTDEKLTDEKKKEIIDNIYYKNKLEFTINSSNISSIKEKNNTSDINTTKSDHLWNNNLNKYKNPFTNLTSLAFK
jgi:hypothetical protein